MNRALRSIGWALTTTAALWISADAPADTGGEGLLATPATMRYRVDLRSFATGGQPLLESAATIEVRTDEDGRHEIDLLSASRFDTRAGRVTEMLIDSADPSTDDLPDGVLLRYQIEGVPRMNGLFAPDIPETAYGLLLEATAILAFQSRQFGFDRLCGVGDEVEFEGFTYHWARPRGNVEARKTTAGGRAVYESLEDGVATVLVTLEPYQWISKWGYTNTRIRVAKESYAVRLRINAETGVIVSAATTENLIELAEVEVQERLVPLPDEAPPVPDDAVWYRTTREISLTPIDG